MSKRADNLDVYTAKVLETLADDCNDIECVPPHGCREYEWWEIRESIIRCLFELDHQQTYGEIHAAFVKEFCT